MLADPLIEHHALRVGQRKLDRCSLSVCDAFPQLLDQLESGLDTKLQDLGAGGHRHEEERSMLEVPDRGCPSRPVRPIGTGRSSSALSCRSRGGLVLPARREMVEERGCGLPATTVSTRCLHASLVAVLVR